MTKLGCVANANHCYVGLLNPKLYRSHVAEGATRGSLVETDMVAGLKDLHVQIGESLRSVGFAGGLFPHCGEARSHG